MSTSILLKQVARVEKLTSFEVLQIDAVANPEVKQRLKILRSTKAPTYTKSTDNKP